MTEVISVKFKEGGKSYFFGPSDNTVSVGDAIIVETQSGKELGYVSEANHMVDDEQIVKPLCKMLRFANEKDFKKLEENRQKEKDALGICESMVEKHHLDMKLVDVEYSFDGGRIVFFFTADGRVDFRELVKDLAAYFHTRIELRQIGVRDEAKMLGGIGICGQPYCCKQFLNDFQTVSIKMAKEQGLSLNPTKVSGSCGRLMCCLKYEQDAYEHLNSFTPNVGATVKTPDGMGIVTDVNLITGNLFVKLTEGDSIPFKIHRDKVKLISRSKKQTNKENNG
ncbi:MAG: stage 0 sporulation family protein [Clostridia bacterium]|nr:stage 0 sporulation family protein [Clostridia bacterium]